MMKLLITSLAALLICSSASAKKPHIILIMADDVSWECFGSYGAQDYKTPELDKLAKQGVQFNHCYSTPICTTSRVMIMTGQYNFRNYTHFGLLHPKDKTFGNLLHAAGYKTAVAGKWQLNGLYNKLPGSNDAQRPLKSGFDAWCLWQLTKPKTAGSERFWNPAIEQNGKVLPKKSVAGKYGPDMMSDFLCDFFEKHHKQQPVFLYYPMVLVHNPFVPTPDSLGPNGKKTNKQPKDAKLRKKNFVAMVNYMDKIVGKIVKKVDDLGELENTLILFTADNGTNEVITSLWNNQPIQGGKGGMKDMGTHVPLIAYWKGTSSAGTVLSDLVDFTDFYPTLAEAAGIQMGENDPTDGRSFLSRLRGEKGNPRDWALCHYQCYWDKTPGQFARTQQYKLYRDGRFFSVPNDLKETTDLSKEPMSPEAKKAHQKLQATLEQCPPAPTERLGRDAKKRPLYPDWPHIK
ncbi:MAG: sulfatase-like hydrolase/transferase [Akkermansiaceae bacterium]|nr:sulfatase-like hydrolase/transferase [Akkermansiaceae bacterium]